MKAFDTFDSFLPLFYAIVLLILCFFNIIFTTLFFFFLILIHLFFPTFWHGLVPNDNVDLDEAAECILVIHLLLLKG